MAKRKKTKRRSPKKKTQRSDEPDEAEQTEEADAEGDDDDAVDASFDDEDEGAEDEVAASSDVEERPNLADRPVGPALDPGSPNARVSKGGGLWVMAVVFGLILAAVLVQYFLG